MARAAEGDQAGRWTGSRKLHGPRCLHLRWRLNQQCAVSSWYYMALSLVFFLLHCAFALSHPRHLPYVVGVRGQIESSLPVKPGHILIAITISSSRSCQKTILCRPPLEFLPYPHWINDAYKLNEGQDSRFWVRTRYRQELCGARIFNSCNDLFIIFDEPHKSITPGQFAAWYIGEELVGSGVICK